MLKVQDRPGKTDYLCRFPEDDRLLIVLDLIVSYGKFYKEWKRLNPDKVCKIQD